MKYYSDDKVITHKVNEAALVRTHQIQKCIKIVINSGYILYYPVLIIFQSLLVKYISNSVTFSFPSYELFKEVK